VRFSAPNGVVLGYFFSMRFTFLTTLYPSYIKAFYAARPGLESRPYDEQKAALDFDGFAWNGALEPALKPLGYVVHSVYANVAPLQRAWATEQGISWPATGWVEGIAWRQLQAFRPEILWVDGLTVFRRRWIDRARETCLGLRWVLGFAGVDLYDLETVKACDAMFSCAWRPVEYFRRVGGKAFLFRHAFNPAILSRMPPAIAPLNELLFAGSIARGEGSHLERERLIETLVAAVPMAIHCPQSEISYRRDWIETNLRRSLYIIMQTLKQVGVDDAMLRRLPKVGQAADWRAMPMRRINPGLHRRMKAPIYGVEMFTAVRNHEVTLKTHIDLARAEAGNSRLFEATGVGGCLLTDWKANLKEMFELDREVAVYRSHEECLEKARWLLNHPSERNALARAGQVRVLREHTFAHRAVELDRLIHAELMS